MISIIPLYGNNGKSPNYMQNEQKKGETNEQYRQSKTSCRICTEATEELSIGTKSEKKASKIGKIPGLRRNITLVTITTIVIEHIVTQTIICPVLIQQTKDNKSISKALIAMAEMRTQDGIVVPDKT